MQSGMSELITVNPLPRACERWPWAGNITEVGQTMDLLQMGTVVPPSDPSARHENRHRIGQQRSPQNLCQAPATPDSTQPPHSIPNIKLKTMAYLPPSTCHNSIRIVQGLPAAASTPYNLDLSTRYPICKSFRRDILRGYLQNTSFVFIDLAGKRVFWGIYP
jgi:hypothetical protein